MVVRYIGSAVSSWHQKTVISPKSPETRLFDENIIQANMK